VEPLLEQVVRSAVGTVSRIAVGTANGIAAGTASRTTAEIDARTTGAAAESAEATVAELHLKNSIGTKLLAGVKDFRLYTSFAVAKKLVPISSCRQ
jgi:hypothetical protein